MSYADALDREAEWYGLDLVDDGIPALASADGGPFDVVATHVRRLAQAGHQLYLAHGPTTQPASSKSTTRLDHQVAALVLWAAVGAGARAHVDQASMEEAVAKVIARVIGPVGDVGHGGRWFKVGPVSTEPANVLDLLRFADVIGAAGAAHTVIVRYTVTEFV
ncbi:MAG TPA: hypothetical protein VJ653_07315 [Acidimicrobiales bacterium]|nr:hypothetical protein [Acidimicrobiales bacterium]